MQVCPNDVALCLRAPKINIEAYGEQFTEDGLSRGACPLSMNILGKQAECGARGIPPQVCTFNLCRLEGMPRDEACIASCKCRQQS